MRLVFSELYPVVFVVVVLLSVSLCSCLSNNYFLFSVASTSAEATAKADKRTAGRPGNHAT